MRKTNRGFTIIETMVYLALFAILFGGAVVSAYNLFESNARGQTKVMMQEEGSFLIGKISWALSGAKSVERPAVGSSGARLSVTKWDTALNPVVIELDGENMTISRNGATPVNLNNNNVTINDLNFAQHYGGGTNPQSIRFSFTLTAKMPGGEFFSQSFSGEKFIRK